MSDETYKDLIDNVFVQTLLQLLDQQSFERITVKRLCEEAGRSRTIFYQNFQSMEDLRIKVILCYLTLLDEDRDMPTEGELPKDILRSVSLHYAEVMQEHRFDFTVLLNNGSFGFSRMFKERLVQLFRHLYGVNGREYVYSLFAASTVELFTTWLRYDKDFLSSEFSEIIRKWSTPIDDTLTITTAI